MTIVVLYLSKTNCSGDNFGGRVYNVFHGLGWEKALGLYPSRGVSKEISFLSNGCEQVFVWQTMQLQLECSSQPLFQEMWLHSQNKESNQTLIHNLFTMESINLAPFI